MPESGAKFQSAATTFHKYSSVECMAALYTLILWRYRCGKIGKQTVLLKFGTQTFPYDVSTTPIQLHEKVEFSAYYNSL